MTLAKSIKVFISATTQDLREHRIAARDELRKADIDAKIMDDFAPDCRPLPEMLKKEISNCDAVICLIGCVLGEKPSDVSNSYTQLEYKYAKDAGIPTYVFMTQEEPKDFHWEDDEKKRIQTKHRKEIERSNKSYTTITTVDRLRADIAQTALKIIMDKVGKIINDQSREDNKYSNNTIGKFKIISTIESREIEDIFLAHPKDSGSEPEIVRLRVLRQNTSEKIRRWFDQRYRCWMELDHPSVVSIQADSDLYPPSGQPFLVLNKLDGWEPLTKKLQFCEPLSQEKIFSVFSASIELSNCASQKGLRLLTLPPGNIFLKGDKVKFEGFETASPEKEGIIQGDEWANISLEWRHMAPELHNRPEYLPETVDVFALGVLLERLNRRDGRPMNELRGDARLDPFQCMAFHCLAHDPRIRLQSLRHVRLLFQDRIEKVQDPEPILVDIEGGKLKVAKYLTTNSDYELFCRETGHRLPYYLTKDGPEERRLSGPWLPVTCISLKESEAYCEWLSRRTGIAWRLPTASEWRMAATLREIRGLVHKGESIYPWGNKHPSVTCDLSLMRGNFGPHFEGPTVVGAFIEDPEIAECLDLSGNVWEWVADRDPPYRLAKGGAYNHNPETLQIDSYKAGLSTTRDPHIGFRVVTGGTL